MSIGLIPPLTSQNHPIENTPILDGQKSILQNFYYNLSEFYIYVTSTVPYKYLVVNTRTTDEKVFAPKKSKCHKKKLMIQ